MKYTGCQEEASLNNKDTNSPITKDLDVLPDKDMNAAIDTDFNTTNDKDMNAPAPTDLLSFDSKGDEEISLQVEKEV